MNHLSHTDLHITRDEADVQSIVNLLDDDWTHPFDPNESGFVSISTDTMAPPEVQGTSLMRTNLARQHTKNSSETGLKTNDQRLSSMTK